MIGERPYVRLSGAQGHALFSLLAGFDEAHAAAAVRAARRIAPADVCAAAIATAFARRRARASGKFPAADDMLFTRAGYEQASSERVARHRAERFTGMGEVLDLCCGIGSDAGALARTAAQVIACDTDADVLDCAAYNTAALGVRGRVRFELADALAVPLGAACAAFADPSRRDGSARARDPRAYTPPLDALLARARELPGGRLAVKVAPGIDADAPWMRGALGGLPLEIEFVSERGACKEAVLWCGGFARADGARRATTIDETGVHVLDGEARPFPERRALGAYLAEPDGAVVRAGLVAQLCAAIGAAPLDPRVAYLGADAPARSPFARWYAVRDALPFGVKRLRAYLREHDIGRLVVKTRAFPLTPEEVVRLVKPAGDASAVLVLATLGGRKTAIVCDALAAHAADRSGRARAAPGQKAAPCSTRS